MHRSIEPHPHHLRYAACIIAICLVDLCLQHRPHVPRLNANHRQARFGENAVKPLRQRSGFQRNSLEAIGVVRKHLQESALQALTPSVLSLSPGPLVGRAREIRRLSDASLADLLGKSVRRAARISDGSRRLPLVCRTPTIGGSLRRHLPQRGDRICAMVQLVYIKPSHGRRLRQPLSGRYNLVHRHKWTTRPEVIRVACLYLCLVCHASLLSLSIWQLSIWQLSICPGLGSLSI